MVVKNIRTYRCPLLFLSLISFLIGCTPSNDIKPDDTLNGGSSLPFELNPNIWPKIPPAVPKDEAIEQRAKQILADMTVEQKVAQIIQPEIRDITVEDMRRYGFGSYLNGGGAFPNENKHSSVQDWVDLAEAMYQASVDDSIDGSSIPTMWGTDAVHGHNNVIGATLFPHNIGLGAARNPELIEEIAHATAREVMATGIDWIFAPTVATARDDRWGRTYESYSEHPQIVKDYAEAIVRGLQGTPGEDFLNDEKVISTVKHFLGDGGTEEGDDQGNNLASEQELLDIHGQGYVGGLSAGAQSVMATFNSWHGDKIHGSHYLLTTVLKEQMGFDGFVVGDWNGHGQVKGCSNYSCPQALNAGLDVYMVPTRAWKPLYENLIKQVNSGEIAEQRINDAVLRVLRVKLRAGIFEKPSPAKRPLSAKTELIGAPAHRKIAAKAVRESLVLLKNNDGLLPLNPSLNVLVAGDGADNIGKQSGGWSITWQGTGNTNDDFPGGTSIYDGIKSQVEAAGGQVQLSAQGNYDTKPDVAIVVFGEEPYAEGTGDLDNLEFQRGNKQDIALLQRLQRDNIKVVSVFLSGRPLWINAELNASNAFVAAWLPGTEGHAVADLLFTDESGGMQHDFTGKLSFSWPNTPQQTPLNYDDTPYEPLFPFGYGLSVADNIEIANDLPEVFEASNEVLSDRVLFDRVAKHPWKIGIGTQQEVVAMNTNSLHVGSVNARTTDRRVQEDALMVDWTDKTPHRFGVFSNFPEDLRSYLDAEAYLQFDYSVPQSTMLNVAMNCQFGCDNPMEIQLTGSASEEWFTVQIPLTCFAALGVDFTQVMSPISISLDKNVELALSDLKIAVAPIESAQNHCPSLN